MSAKKVPTMPTKREPKNHEAMEKKGGSMGGKKGGRC